MSKVDPAERIWRRRARVLLGGFLAIGCMLGARAFELQVLHHDFLLGQGQQRQPRVIDQRVVGDREHAGAWIALGLAEGVELLEVDLPKPRLLGEHPRGGAVERLVHPDEATRKRPPPLRRVLGTLTPREEKVLKMRFGIGERSNHTLEEVGQDFEVTRERIRQIEAKALRKLRHPSRAKVLRAFLD